MKILVADDSATMRCLVVQYLKAWNYETVEAVNGREAWERYCEDRFQLVLTDWIMPEMDGLELVKKIRDRESDAYTYLILLTSKSEKEYLVSAMEAGADDFLIKPCDPEELRVRVREGERIVRLEQELQERNRKLRETQAALIQSEKLASLGQLAAGMAHEINNPISYVANNLAILRRDISDLIGILEKYHAVSHHLAEVAPELANEIGKLESQCDIEWIKESLPRLFDSSLDGVSRVRDIVTNLRDFARLDEAELDDLDVNAALRSTVKVLDHEINSCQVDVEFDLQDDLSPFRCRPAKLHQAFYGIILNAVQASQPEDVVTIRTSSDQDYLDVMVEDEGCGIDPVHLPSIFEPFFTTKRVGRGSGLGLAVSYGIVRDHGGVINVESRLDKGSKFLVRLPNAVGDE